MCIRDSYKTGERNGSLIATELYDYQNDPLETVNQSDNPDYKQVVKAFENEFKRRNVAQLN